MQKNFFFLGVTLIALLVLFSCEGNDGDDSKAGDGANPIEAVNVDQSGCTQIAESIFEYLEGGYNEVFSFSWDPAGTMSVSHQHGCFNCGFSAEPAYRIEGDSIRIIEFSQPDFIPADCNCPMDVSYDLTDVPPGVYEVTVSVQYLGEGSEGPEVLLQKSIYLPKDKEESYTFTQQHTDECI